MSKLYTPRLLALSAELAKYPLTGSFDRTAQARSRTCGSTLEIGVTLNSDGVVERLGMQVTACAIGQSSAAVMAANAMGRPAHNFVAARDSIQAWLAGEGGLPDWPGFDALEPALPHPGRHGALLLPWTAIVEALSSERHAG